MQAVIGRVHADTEPAKRMLLEEGFTETDEVDIFDAGPLVRAKRDRIRTIKARRLTTLRALHPKMPPDAEKAIIASASLEFRSCLGLLRVNAEGTIDLDAATAKRLKLSVGDEVQFVTSQAAKRTKS